MTIDDYVFDHCVKLSEITIPKNTTYVGNHAFEECKALKSMVLSEGITFLGESAFSGCRQLEAINLPKGITSIRANTFFGCGQLRSIGLPDGLTSIGDKAFENCHALEEMNLTGSVTEIGNGIFAGCTHLNSVVLPPVLKSLPDSLFNSCKNLESVTMPEKLTVIGDYIFCDCEKLRSITIPDGIAHINGTVFQGCRSLNEIAFSATVTRITKNAFKDCSDLSAVVFAGTYAERFCKAYNIPYESTDLPESYFDSYYSGRVMTFGRYEQNNSKSDGLEPIEWIILDNYDGLVTLISKYGLDVRVYNDSSSTKPVWEKSSLRTWLNDKFLQTAFSTEEHGYLQTAHVKADTNPFGAGMSRVFPKEADTQDMVYILAYDDANEYFVTDEERVCYSTAYARAQGAYAYENNACAWWLKTIGSRENFDSDGVMSDLRSACRVDFRGAIDTLGSHAAYGETVRPVVTVRVSDLDSLVQLSNEIDKKIREESVLNHNPFNNGEIVRIGHYEQDNDPTNGADEIEWIILDNDGENCILMSRYALDYKQFHSERKERGNITWDQCALRAWLNNDFLQSAFTEEERLWLVTKTIEAEGPYAVSTEDMVYLLACGEIEEYIPSVADRVCYPTEYARTHVSGSTASHKACYWWSRTPDSVSNHYTAIDLDGTTERMPTLNQATAVRPVIVMRIPNDIDEWPGLKGEH